MEKGKVQTNVDGINVLVETESSNSNHYSSLDFKVECEKMSDQEITEAYKKLNPVITIDSMKDALKTKEGYAISNCAGEQFAHNDLFKYKKSNN